MQNNCAFIQIKDCSSNSFYYMDMISKITTKQEWKLFIEHNIHMKMCLRMYENLFPLKKLIISDILTYGQTEFKRTSIS